MNELKVGANYKKKFTISDELVKNYIDLLGDKNPIHYDTAYAKKTKFGKTIAHGDLIIGYISQIVGTEFPGKGTIYLMHSFIFKKPIYIGETITIEVVLNEINQKYDAVLSFFVRNINDEIAIDGVARVKLPGWIEKKVD
ncbi:MAG: MaoC family dehydratase [Spirochaetes bacterium]|jgi:3-hydroxybutyryl-CoA dehydratase|nr:MaoC family dehydratase [Spirochaetota bacterium]